jgi:hypothetical protein
LHFIYRVLKLTTPSASGLQGREEAFNTLNPHS